MKVIDLLNKIAKGEEVPKKIKYKNHIYIKDNEGLDFYVRDFGTTLLLEEIIDTNYLNDEIEIIEEKEIEELKDIYSIDHKWQHENNKIFKDKINELVRELNKIKKEGK